MEPSNPNIFQQKFLILREMELSDHKIKKILIFSLKKASRIFREMEPFKRTSCISGGNFLRSKNKKGYSRKNNVLNFRK